MKHRYPNVGVACRRLLVTTTRFPAEHPRLDRCWGSGETREDDKRWPRVPKWMAPEGAFKFTGYAVSLRRSSKRALVVGWITERRPLDAVLADEVRGSIAA